MKKVNSKINIECEEILRELVMKHPCLHPESKEFDIWDNEEAAEIVADLIEKIRYSDVIELEAKSKDWGK
jgi:hypothetical protein